MNKELYEIVISEIDVYFGDGDCIEPCDKKACAERIVEVLEKASFRKANDLMDEIAGLTGKVEALQRDNENLRRTLEQGRSYKYSGSCAGCELEEICKYAQHYNFCEDCKEYPDCPIHVDCTECPCGRTVECNNGFEDKSYLDDDANEEEGEE